MSVRQWPSYFSFVICVSFASLGYAQDSDVEQWRSQLSSNDPTVWQKADADLINRGTAAESILKQLSSHSDRWVAERAKRIWMDIRGIDAALPRHEQQAIFHFSQLTPEEQKALLARLQSQGPNHLSAVAYLYNQATLDAKLTVVEMREWQSRLQSAIYINPNDVSSLKATNYRPETLAFIHSCMPDSKEGKAKTLYEQWRNINPEIRFHLNARQVNLEILHLKANATTLDLLRFLPKIKDIEAKRAASESIHSIAMADKSFSPESLDADASMAHLLCLSSASEFDKVFVWYEKHLSRIPDLFTQLPPDLKVLEITRLAKQGQHEKAILLAIQADESSMQNRRFSSPDRYRAATSKLGTNPDALPNGFPKIDDPARLPHLRSLLSTWYQSDLTASNPKNIEAKVECFDRWARSEEWLEAARKPRPLSLYYLLMAKRGKFDQVMLDLEFDPDKEALSDLGKLLLSRPEIGSMIPAGKCSIATLGQILTGAMSGSTLSGHRRVSSLPAIDLASSWQKIHPQLLAKDSFPAQALYLAAMDWNAGKTADAASAILACTKPITNEYAGKTHENLNPLFIPALYLLVDLLGNSPDVDINDLLKPENTSQEVVMRMLERMNNIENRNIVHIQHAMSLSHLLRDRYGIKDARTFLTSFDALKLALNAWTAGDEAMATKILELAFIFNADEEERYDPSLAWSLSLLGNAEPTLGKLDASKGFLPLPVYQSKRARLLHVLDRNQEALETISREHQPLLLLNLATTLGNWDAATDAINKQERHQMTHAVLASIDILSEDPARIKRHAYSELPLIALLNGDPLTPLLSYANFIEYKDIARDYDISSHNEKVITQSLISGNPIPFMELSNYYLYFDRIVDKTRALKLAEEIAKAPQCLINSQPNSYAHKSIVGTALLCFGRGNIAYQAMRGSLLASLQKPNDFKFPIYFTSRQSRHFIEAYETLSRIARIEWPNATPEQQLEKLDAILDHVDPTTRAKNIIDLIGRQQQNLQTEQLIKVLWLPLADLAHSDKVPDEIKNTAFSYLKSKNPKEADIKLLESFCSPMSWDKEMLGHGSGSLKNAKRTARFHPQKGSRSNPRQQDFVLIDGLFSVHELIKGQKNHEASALLRDCVIRLLLDTNLLRQEVEWNTRIENDTGSEMSKFDTEGARTLVHYIEFQDFPPEVSLPVLAACTEAWTNVADQERFLHAANHLSHHGKHKEALPFYQRYLIHVSRYSGSFFHGATGRAIVVKMLQSRGFVAAQNGDGKTAARVVALLANLAPYDPDNATQIIQAMRQHCDAPSLDSARNSIQQFWRLRLIEIPTSQAFLQGKTKWDALFP